MPGMRVRTRNRPHIPLPEGLAEGTEVEVVRIDSFVCLVRDEVGGNWAVCLDCLVPPSFMYMNGRWVRSDQGHM